MNEYTIAFDLLEMSRKFDKNAESSAEVSLHYREPYQADAEYELKLIDEYCRTIDNLSSEQSSVLVAGC